jgi:DNA modification methylase
MTTNLNQLSLYENLSEPFAYKLGFAIKNNAIKRNELLHKYSDKLVVTPELNRSLVSFQANKTMPFYRWFKYREGFSNELVRHFLRKYSKPLPARILDPFAGGGTTLTTATKEGWEATGIELLPVGTSVIKARLKADTVDIEKFRNHFDRLLSWSFDIDDNEIEAFRFRHVKITGKAFSAKTEKELAAYLYFVSTIDDEDVRYLFWFASFAILEEISFTRKDGQYLRWDNRSERNLKATFNKGVIYDFRPTVIDKLHQIIQDIEGRNGGSFSQHAEVISGSCLSELPNLPSNNFDMVMTSPPYCNRYDYTRTYALELAFLGNGEAEIKNLRQTLLSATVENKTKRSWLAEQYRELNREDDFNKIDQIFSNQEALQEVLRLLYQARDRKELNNNNIPNLVENYFYEMCFVIYELSRVLAPNGHVIMVNDNVQYIGEEVPVDLILSDFAEMSGLTVEKICVLPRGKGNSSQQMGIHGRTELRKCVYIWSKPN